MRTDFIVVVIFLLRDDYSHVVNRRDLCRQLLAWTVPRRRSQCSSLLLSRLESARLERSWHTVYTVVDRGEGASTDS